MLVAARFGPFATSEQELADPLWAEVPGKSITILDRGFVDYTQFSSFIDVAGERRNRGKRSPPKQGAAEDPK